MNCSGILTALIGEIKFVDTKVFNVILIQTNLKIMTFVTEPTLGHFTGNSDKSAAATVLKAALLTLDNYIKNRLDNFISFACNLAMVNLTFEKSRSSSIAAIKMYISTIPSPPELELCFIFLVHLAMLDALSLRARAQADYFSSLCSRLNNVVHQIFLPRMYHLLGISNIETGIDPMDGRLFGRLIWEFTNPSSSIDMNDPIIQKTQESWAQLTVHTAIKLDLENFRLLYPRVSTPIIPEKVHPQFGLTAFSHPVLSQYLLDPILNVPDAIGNKAHNNCVGIGFRRAIVHSEDTHWRSGPYLLSCLSEASRKGFLLYCQPKETGSTLSSFNETICGIYGRT